MEQREDDGRHETRLSENIHNLNRGNAYGVFDSHTFLAALAALSFANIEACLTRPHAFALTVLLWHGGTVTAVAAICALTGHRWLRWPDLTTR